MKKFFFLRAFLSAFCLAALFACLAIPNATILAAGDSINPDAILCADDSGQYSYIYTKAEPGTRYALIVSSGIYKTPGELDMDKIMDSLLYIDQKTAGDARLSFEGIIPSRAENATVILTSPDNDPIIAGYISKDMLRAERYYQDASSQMLLKDTITIKKNASWEEVKASLPASCYLKINSDHMASFSCPVSLTWNNISYFDSTKAGKSFKITADAALFSDALAIVRPLVKPFSMTVTVEDDLSIPTKITAIKAKTVYKQGEDINSDDIFVKALYSDGTVRDVTDWTADIDKLSKEPGAHDFTVTYTAADKTLTAKISILIQPAAQPDNPKNTYQIVFETFGGSYVPNRFVEENALLGTLPNPVKNGFTFTGWYTDSSRQTQYDAAAPATQDMTLYAGWRSVDEHMLTSLKVTLSNYNFPHGELLTEDMITVYAIYDDETRKAVAAFTHDLSEIDQTTPGKKTLHVTYIEGDVTKEDSINFKIIEDAGQLYTVDFNTNCTQSINAQNVAKGELLKEPGITLSREDYVFSGWELDGRIWDFAKDTVMGDMTLNAKWLKKYGDADFCYTDEIPDYVYTGKAQKPAVTVRDKNQNLLTLNKDYTIRYVDNTKVSESAKVIISGRGNYAGTAETVFRILPKNIKDETAVSLKATEYYTYRKAGYTPLPTLKYNGMTLRNNQDFAVSYQKLEQCDSTSGSDITGTVLKDAGWYLAIVTGKGNYTGNRTFRFEIVPTGKKNLSGATLKLDKAAAKFPYTGSEASIGWGIKLSFGKTTLQEDVDYTLEYPEDNVSIGKKQVIARAVPESSLYYGTKLISYEITGLSIRQTAIALKQKRMPYAGTPIDDNIDKVTLKLDKAKAQLLNTYYGRDDLVSGSIFTLQENTDYTVSYRNNKNTGTAVITLTGKGFFTGTIESRFPIDRIALNDTKLTATLEETTVKQDKAGVRIPVKVVHTEDEQQFVLQENVDYTLQYQNNKAVGTNAKVVISGKGNYKGSVTKVFAIEKKELSDKDIKISVIDPVNAKSKPQVFVYDKITLLKLNTDYAVDYKSSYIVVKGTAKGSYSGEQNIPYQVQPQNIADKKYTFTIADQIYTGKPVTFTPGSNAFTVTTKEGKIVKTVNLVLGRDFEIVSYSRNIATGTASVVIKGIDGYGSSRTVNFKIVRQKLYP